MKDDKELILNVLINITISMQSMIILTYKIFQKQFLSTTEKNNLYFSSLQNFKKDDVVYDLHLNGTYLGWKALVDIEHQPRRRSAWRGSLSGRRFSAAEHSRFLWT